MNVLFPSRLGRVQPFYAPRLRELSMQSDASRAIDCPITTAVLSTILFNSPSLQGLTLDRVVGEDISVPGSVARRNGMIARVNIRTFDENHLSHLTHVLLTDVSTVLSIELFAVSDLQMALQYIRQTIRQSDREAESIDIGFRHEYLYEDDGLTTVFDCEFFELKVDFICGSSMTLRLLEIFPNWTWSEFVSLFDVSAVRHLSLTHMEYEYGEIPDHLQPLKLLSKLIGLETVKVVDRDQLAFLLQLPLPCRVSIITLDFERGPRVHALRILARVLKHLNRAPGEISVEFFGQINGYRSSQEYHEIEGPIMRTVSALCSVHDYRSFVSRSGR